MGICEYSSCNFSKCSNYENQSINVSYSSTTIKLETLVTPQMDSDSIINGNSSNSSISTNTYDTILVNVDYYRNSYTSSTITLQANNLDNQCTNGDDYQLTLYFTGTALRTEVAISSCISGGGIICGLLGRIDGDSSNAKEFVYKMVVNILIMI